MDTGKILRITDTTLRDGHQSLWATRMRTSDIMGIIDTIDQAGYYSLEVWGGATFDVCLRFLREDPWERLRLIKSKAKKTPLQMLLRGQNIVGYKNYPDDLVDHFVKLSHKNGVDIFRVFDALNDSRNLESAIKSIKKYGAHAQAGLSYTISPVHTVEKYVSDAREMVQLGADSLCIKDMAGILSPTMSNNLVTALKKEFNLPIQVHCHSTSGMSETAYYAGVNAGAGAVDCAVSALAGTSSQPAVETIHAVFTEMGYNTNLDVEVLRTVNRYFAGLAPQRVRGKGHEPSVDGGILIHQIPGGMISNFRSQLEQQDALDRLPEALEEVAKVRADLGFPPLVTPTSQMVGTQAVMNVLAGERYKLVPEEIKNYLKGMYGRSPAPINQDVYKKILGNEKPINHRPADDLPGILPVALKNIANPELLTCEEDILSYCLFPDVSMEYFRWRATPEDKRPKTPADIEVEELVKPKMVEASPLPKGAQPMDKMLHSEDYLGIQAILEKASTMQLNELNIRKGDFTLTLSSGNGNVKTFSTFDTEVKPIVPKEVETKHVPQVIQQTASSDTIDAVMAGTFYIASSQTAPPFVVEGAVVKAGDTICILEAMKLFNEIKTPFNCKIHKILVENGAKIKKGQALMEVEKL